DLNKNLKQNILKAAINPLASAKQTIELPNLHAAIQSHATLPSIYVNTSQDQEANATPQGPEQPQHAQQAEQPWDRFKIVRAQEKQGKRIVGNIKINPLGKTTQEQNLVPTTTEKLTGGWVKVTPVNPLAPGEYALVEMLGKEGMNLYVWDFGVNPSAPANALVTKPDPSALQPPSDKPKELKPPPAN